MQVRHLKRRAQSAADQGDTDTERHCLQLARALCDDSDHELLYDLVRFRLPLSASDCSWMPPIASECL